MIEIFTLITFIFVFLLVIGIILNKSEVTGTAIGFLIFMIATCWIGYGIFAPDEFVETTPEFTIQKDKYHITIYLPDDGFTFSKKIDFDQITDTTTFYFEEGFNIYGFIRRTHAFYKIKDKKYYDN